MRLYNERILYIKKKWGEYRILRMKEDERDKKNRKYSITMRTRNMHTQVDDQSNSIHSIKKINSAI